MTPLLRDLIWAIVLVGFIAFGLDLQESNKSRSQELRQVERLVLREGQRGQQLDWVATEAQALKAQKQWLSLFAPVVSSGKFRAEALESLGDICTANDIPCRLSAGGENVEAASTFSSRVTPSTIVTERSSISTANPGQIFVAVSKVALPLQGESLGRFLAAVENSEQLRVIDKFSARGITAELQIKSYGISQENLSQLIRSNHAAFAR
jgi:hypothetical protein